MSLPKENNLKKEINIKNWIFKWFDKEKLFWMLTIKDNKEKSSEEKWLDAGDRFATAIADDLRHLPVRAKTSDKE